MANLIKDKHRKFLAYLGSPYYYWQNHRAEDVHQFKGIKPGLFPMKIIPRIEQGHYLYFDEEGIPCWPNHQGIMIHHYTTMCSYALGQWELFLRNENKEARSVFLKIADYLLSSGKQHEMGALHYLDYDDAAEKSGAPCAMNQGEAIAVLSRAFALTGKEQYLKTAEMAALAYEMPYGEGGITGYYGVEKTPWYLEGGKFILNGHIYACFGMYDLFNLTGNERYKALWLQGMHSVATLLPKFDSGNWSWYWLDEPKYIASAMYHNLHLCQLEVCADLSEDDKLSLHKKRFLGYSKNPLNRLKALKMMVQGKKQLKART